jgi:hypothetical protein
MDDLAERMHARIRPAGAIGFELPPARGRLERAMQFPLHGAGVLLNLPARVARAGVFHGEFVARHVG